jgi:hypothetical protein
MAKPILRVDAVALRHAAAARSRMAWCRAMEAVTVRCALVSDEHAILQRTLARIEAAFVDAPRPSNDDLLHEQCADDNDIAQLYFVKHWREIPDELVESEYAALSFLSADGFRHFVAADVGFALRNLASGAAAVDSTIWSLAPVFYGDADVRNFVISKLASLTTSPGNSRRG